MGGVDGRHGLIAGQRKVGALQLLGVPASATQKEQGLVFGRRGFGLCGVGDAAEHVTPGLDAVGCEPLDLRGDRLLPRILGESLSERDQVGRGPSVCARCPDFGEQTRASPRTSACSLCSSVFASL